MTVRKLTTQGDVYLAYEGDIFPTAGVADGSFLQVYSADGRSIKEYIFDAVQVVWNPSKLSDQAIQYVADVGVLGERHNRVISGITGTHPSDDTFAVTWDVNEGVRRYRILVDGGSSGDYVRFVEDAISGEQEKILLTEGTPGVDEDVDYMRCYTSTPAAGASYIPQWSEWKDVSKDPSDNPMVRLGFEGSGAGPFSIFVETE